MKKLLLASAIAALSVTAANAAPTVYGKAFLTLDLQDADTDTDVTTYDATGKQLTRQSSSNDDDGRSKLNSNSSRIGFKGSEPLTANTDLVYKLEYGIDVDHGDTRVNSGGKVDEDGNIIYDQKKQKSDQFYARDTYLGVSNKEYGTLLAGRITAIDDEIDYATVAQGGVLGGDNVLASVDGERANNTFAYFSPEYNGIQFMAMYVMDENEDDYDTFGRDAFGIGAKYETGPMNLGATYIGAGEDKQAIRVSGNYAINDAVTLGALYQLTDYDKDEDENTFAISGEMATATPWIAYAQGDVVTNWKGVEDDDKYRVVVGGKYKFNKATTGHLYGAYMNEETKEWSKDKLTKVESDTDAFGVGAGIEYKF